MGWAGVFMSITADGRTHMRSSTRSTRSTGGSGSTRVPKTELTGIYGGLVVGHHDARREGNLP